MAYEQSPREKAKVIETQQLADEANAEAKRKGVPNLIHFDKSILRDKSKMTAEQIKVYQAEEDAHTATLRRRPSW